MNTAVTSLCLVGLTAVLAWLFESLRPVLLYALLGGSMGLSLLLFQLLATQVAVGRWLQRESMLAIAILLAMAGITYVTYTGSIWQNVVLAFLVIGAWIGGLRYKVSSFVLFLLCSIFGSVLL